MESNNKISKFPKGFFQATRPTITASEALKNTNPIKWKESSKRVKSNEIKLVKKNSFK